MHKGASLIEGVAVGPYLVDMCMELCRCGVGAIVQIFLNGFEIHWLLYHIEVVKHAVSFGVDGYQKWIGAFMLFQLSKDEAALRKIILYSWSFVDSWFPHLLRLILQKFIHLLDANSLGSPINVLRIFHIP